MADFEKILIANRGEIAIRVMRAANEMGKKTVAVYAEEDKLGLHRFKADEAYRIGEGMGPVAAYLSIEEVIRVAKASGADAIHPGYGLLSENPDFVDACTAAGIAFIGPRAETMRSLGDKASARQVAIAAGVPVIPATEVLGDDMALVREQAAEVGYPLMLKASWGGGGRGMRAIHSEGELEEKVLEGRREAEAAFGNDAGYLEKLIQRARHVEVQILGDSQGNIYHLYERDCSVQRRNQKVVERAPAPYLSETQRDHICALGKKICAHVGYECAGTVEFLMDMDSGEFFFIEVNPRVQVEHTVTEEVTGIDIVRAQILIAEGKSLTEATGIASQYDVTLDGHAVQCRVTTEDPQNNFIPDYGRITTYRSATGMGIRLDGGTAYSGAVITRYYDSLLEKVTAWAPTPEAAIKRMDRALREFRIRGVSTNIPFVVNLLQHPKFTSYDYSTTFIDDTPELFDFKVQRDRATKILTYISDISVNGHPETAGRPRPADDIRTPRVPDRMGDTVPEGTRQILERDGPKGLADWMLSRDRLLLTDTTMRDGHQSLLATRMRSIDMVRAAPAYATNLPDLLSVECWGGATFDVAYRFLQECPWQRLRDLRAAMPNICTQMLLRASNGVGYTNYPDNVVQSFVTQAAETGVDIFRVFDSLNWVENMRVAMDAVIETGRVCEGTVCYTGDILDPARAKYDLKYYVGMAKSLEAAGAHVLGLKDMAGLLKPAAARVLVRALKEEVGIPVHFHTHDTAGIACATILAATEAGVDAADVAMDAFSGNTSQATFGTILAALKDDPRDPGLDATAVRHMSDYWEAVRGQYLAFESGMQAPSSEVYLHEMPGGQFTNLKSQARSMGLEERWHEVAQMYADVNVMFGDIVKVTPSSKVVGDMASDDGGTGPDRGAGGGSGDGDQLSGVGDRHDARQPRPTPRRLAEGVAEEDPQGRDAVDRAAGQASGARRPRGGAHRIGRQARPGNRRRGSERLPHVSEGLHRLRGATCPLRPRACPADAGVLLRHGAGRRDPCGDRPRQDAGDPHGRPRRDERRRRGPRVLRAQRPAAHHPHHRPPRRRHQCETPEGRGWERGPRRRADARRRCRSGGGGGRVGEEGRPAADDRGDEDGDRAARRPGRDRGGAARGFGGADRREGPAGGTILR